MPIISLIAAASKNLVIGNKGEIPWYLPDDFKHFAEKTKGHTVIMGQKTYESIVARLGHPLPNRKNIVLSFQADFIAPGCTVFNSIEKALDEVKEEKEVFIIGGGKVYESFLPFANKIYLTEVNLECLGDTYFPTYNKNDWEIVSSVYHPKDEKHACDFNFLELVKRNQA
jgi:dihydrofolate reductase